MRGSDHSGSGRENSRPEWRGQQLHLDEWAAAQRAAQ